MPALISDILNLSRKYIILIITLLPFAVKGQYVQDSLRSKQEKILTGVLKTNPLTPFQGPILFTSEYRLSYELLIGMNQSLQLGISWLGKGCVLEIVEAGSSDPIRFIVKGARFQAEYRWYFLTDRIGGKAPEGVYLAPVYSRSQARITNVYFNTRDEYIQATYTHYALKIGHQWLERRICIDVFAGAGYRDISWLEHFNQTTTHHDPSEFLAYPGNLKLIMGFNLGYAF